jgi:hypothetical protein
MEKDEKMSANYACGVKLIKKIIRKREKEEVQPREADSHLGPKLIKRTATSLLSPATSENIHDVEFRRQNICT